jgi:hypothetical protein
MKKILLPLLLLSSTVIFAQSARVQLSFQKDYPDARDARWIQTNDQWHANYRDDRNRNMDVYYDNYGNRTDTHIGWDSRDVPQRVDSRINRRYHTNGDYRVERIERPNYRPLFQIRIGTRTPIYMDDQGRRRRYNDHHY